MKQIGAAKFKEQCLNILNHIDPEGVIITKHNKPIAKLMPIYSKCGELIGCLSKKLKIQGNVFTTNTKWNAQS